MSLQDDFLSLDLSSSESSRANSKIIILSLDDVCDHLIEDRNFDYTNYYQCEDIIENLQLMCEEIISGDGPDYDYDRLKKIDDVLQMLQHKSQELNLSNSKYRDIEKLKESRKEIKEKLDKINEKYEQKRKDFSEKREEALKNLKEAQENELLELRQKYSKDMPLPPKYRKLSSDAMNLKRLERKCRLLHKFEEAKQYKIAGDQREAEEMRQNYADWKNEYRSLKEALKKKHQIQLKCFNEKWDVNSQELRKEEETQKRRHHLALQHNSKKRHDIKAKTKSPTVKPPRITNESRVISQLSMTQSRQSSRFGSRFTSRSQSRNSSVPPSRASSRYSP